MRKIDIIAGTTVVLVAYGCSLQHIDPVNWGNAGEAGTAGETNENGGSTSGGASTKGGTSGKKGTGKGGTRTTESASGSSAGKNATSSDAPQGGTTPGGTSGIGGVLTSGGSGINSTNGGSTAPQVSVTAVPSATPDLVGFKSIVSAALSSSSDGSTLTYSWSFVSVPSGSTMTTASLSDAKSVAATFLPDLGGTYKLQVVVSNGTVSDTKTVDVVVPTIDIGYLRVAGDNSSYTRSGAMIRSDGTNDRLVGCPFTDTATSESAWIGGFRTEGQFLFQSYFPPDITQDARLYYAHVFADPNTNVITAVGQIAGPSTNCSTVATTVGGFTPVFAPSGRRLQLFIPNENILATVATDGTDRRDIRTNLITNGFPAPAWVDDTHVVWAEYGTDTNKTNYALVYKATDRTGAFNDNLEHETLMTCLGAANPFPYGISQVVQKNNYLYLTVVSFDASGTSSTKVLWRLDPVNGEYRCDTKATSNHILYANAPNSFELSPDGSQIVFFVLPSTDPNAPVTSAILLSSTNPGSTPKTLVANDGDANIGVRWIAGGRQIIWTKTTNQSIPSGTGGSTSIYYRPVSSSLWIMNADGSNPRQLRSYSSTSTQVRAVNSGSLDGMVLCGISRVGSRRGASCLALVVLCGIVGSFRRRELPRRSSHSRKRC